MDRTASDSDVEVIDWGSAVIMPGLINAHTHLELSGLAGQLTHFDSFTDWLSQLIDRRRTWTREQFLNSVSQGTRDALASGTTLAGDISSSGFAWEASRGSRLRRVIFEEVLALSPADAGTAMTQLEARLNAATPDPLLTQGISPHAPYSVSPELYRRTAELARLRGMLLATHVAETKAERQFLQTGTGEFRDFLQRLGSLAPDWAPPQLDLIEFLDALGVLGPSTVLVHCNYLAPDSIPRILNTRSSVVYCPRSHDFFGHEKHPVRQLLDSGVNVALGTDSLASNRSVSLLDEMRYLFKIRKDLKSEEIFRAGTLNGAAALGFGGVLGRLRRGYWADLAILQLPENFGPRQFTAQLLEGAGDCIATIVQGEIAWRKDADYDTDTGARSRTDQR